MSGGVFLMQDSGTLVEMREAAYDSEALLQELLAQYPSLLAGDQINVEAPRRWLLVTREMSVPGEQDGAGRWSLDHLFLDQDGVPTLVEVKRSTDTRLRREVVGQMLDYAANAVAYWPVEMIRLQFERTCEHNGLDAQQALAELLTDESDTERFWQQVKTNLHAGRIRMVFVADHIPPELQRIIEFLNTQMGNAEVLGVAIPQYAGQGQRLFVPRVLGFTATAQQQKSAERRDTRQWDEASFFAELESRRGPDEVAVGRRILDWARNKKLRFWWGKGQTSGSFFPMLDVKGRTQWTVSVWTYGTVEIQFKQLMKQQPFQDETLRRELRERLIAIPGIRISESEMTQRPPVRFRSLTDAQALTRFLEELDWLVDTIRKQGMAQDTSANGTGEQNGQEGRSS
jgi:hypothetical protein